MNDQERRKDARINSFNLLSLDCIDENGTKVMQNMGRTLNVSESGILLETSKQIPMNYTVILNVGFQEDIVAILGKAIYSKQNENKKFSTGIKFVQMDNDSLLMLKKYIRKFNEM